MGMTEALNRFCGAMLCLESFHMPALFEWPWHDQFGCSPLPRIVVHVQVWNPEPPKSIYKKDMTDIGVSKKSGYPQIIYFHRGFPWNKPSILGVFQTTPIFWFNTQYDAIHLIDQPNQLGDKNRSKMAKSPSAFQWHRTRLQEHPLVRKLTLWGCEEMDKQQKVWKTSHIYIYVYVYIYISPPEN